MNYQDDIPADLAARAHAGTSFVPDDRARTERAEYAQTLAADYAAMERYATTDDKRATLDAEFARYRAGYRTRFVARLTAMSRCMSTMITGGSNFPTRRNAKRSDTADRRTTELIEFRERALAAIRKALTPELRPVMSGDSDAVARLTDKIATAEKIQGIMKAANQAIRVHAKAGTDAQVAALVALGVGFTEARARELLTPDFCNRIGFASYELTNNNANIRRMRERLATITQNQATPSTEIAGERARLEDSPADNRVRLFYPGKPDSEVRARLKRAGFRWTPSLGCWQAYRNHATMAVAHSEAGADPASAA